MENVYPIKSKTGVCRGISIFFLSFASNHKIVGTSLNRLGEAVITCTHNLCFDHEKKKQTFSTENFHFFSSLNISVYCMGMFS